MAKFKSYQCRVLDFGEGMIAIQHHSTVIVKTYPERGREVIELNHGGWSSVTTKRKMNEIAGHYGLKFSVHQHKHQWFVTTKAGVYPYDDRIFVIDRETGLPWGVVELFLNNKAEGRAA